MGLMLQCLEYNPLWSVYISGFTHGVWLHWCEFVFRRPSNWRI